MCSFKCSQCSRELKISDVFFDDGCPRSEPGTELCWSCDQAAYEEAGHNSPHVCHDRGDGCCDICDEYMEPPTNR